MSEKVKVTESSDDIDKKYPQTESHTRPLIAKERLYQDYYDGFPPPSLFYRGFFSSFLVIS